MAEPDVAFGRAETLQPLTDEEGANAMQRMEGKLTCLVVASALLCASPASAHMTERCVTALQILISEEVENQVKGLLPGEFPPTPQMVCYEAELNGIERNDCPPPASASPLVSLFAAQKLVEKECTLDARAY